MVPTGLESADCGWKRAVSTSLATILVVCIMATSGCARLNSIYRNNPIDDNVQSVSIDAKQRMIFTAPKLDENGDATNYRVVCAEPSPDVFSAFAASLSGSLESDSIEAALEGAFSENAATIGLRTQVIQLLRDGMYRICEGVLSNQISEDEFYSLHQRYQRIMVTLVAIEQLTGAVTPPPITIQTDALAGRPARLPELQSDLDEAEDQLTSAEGTLGELEEPEKDKGACDEIKDDDERKEQCKEYYVAKNDRDEKQATVESLKEAIKVARSEVVYQAGGQVFVSTAFQRNSMMTEETIDAISGTVEELVGSLWSIDFDTALKKYGEFRCDRFRDAAGEVITSAQIMNRFRALDQSPNSSSERAELRSLLGYTPQSEINLEGSRPEDNDAKQLLREASMCAVLRNAVASTTEQT